MTTYGNLINGEWVVTGNTFNDINPSDTNDIIGTYSTAGEAEVKAAIDAAREAFKTWQFSTPQQRFDVLDNAGTEILARKAELGALLSREEGKTLPEGIGEVTRAGHIFKYFAGEALRAHGEVLDSVRPGVKVEITREPVGVIGLICPWNFPIAIPAWKMAPAIAFGNTVVCKPAELTPACAWALADILTRAGLPKGVLNVVFARGSVAGPLLIDGCDAISFTGSVPTGTRVRDQAVAKGKRIQAEMGGKNPVIVLDDADLNVAVNSVLNSAFFSSGHRCTASSRIIVTEGIADTFVAKLAEAAKAIKVGDSRADGVQMGPIASQEQLKIAQDAVAKAKAEGAEILSGGEDLTFGTPGYYYAPTLIDKTTPAMSINKEEVFGPVASIIRVKDLEEAIKVANDTEFGLSAGICTTSLKSAETFKRRSEAGMVMVNLPTAGVDYHVPFGGRKGSSYGPREQGAYAKEFYTIVKTAYTSA
ncbi:MULTISPECIES: aldehyde dehydrogenase family protein [Asticcacaulis]|uniref:Aldehyde dehydrogenase n=1 Tax=Asticcacaulis endophyticus TaxID=1395890 RepID=A0A918PTY3_9CAUL|nr:MULTISPECIES: aldehyde dehydrogenase family protein [Asticcacaulis]WAC47492.1 aldehyde dehydrogenase family protein [Asticcacaulis sp. SL142]GGZ22609.1 aldehyde dehydrogenase [Asticcacaulis endophyticus]